MDRDTILLAALAASGENAAFTPVQVQKLFFLLDREGAALLNGPHFHFEPYDYGPFDRAVYDAIEDLSRKGLSQIQHTGKYRLYSLSEKGYSAGRSSLDNLPEPTRKYLSDVANWVRRLPFDELVSAIYNRYPEMKAKSVFRG